MNYDNFPEYFPNKALVSIKHFIIGQFVTVGWGKKETQFHGSLGKQAAQVKPQVLYGFNCLGSKSILL